MSQISVIVKTLSKLYLSYSILGMKEKKTRTVKITDAKPETVKAMLDDIYTNQTDELSEDILTELLMLADKYNITSLLNNVTLALAKMINMENCIQIRRSAKMFNAKVLEHQCILCIVKRYQEISQLELWKNTSQEDPELVKDVLNEMAKQVNN